MINFFSAKSYISILTGERKARSILLIFITAIIVSIHPSYYFISAIYPKILNFQKQVDTLVNDTFPEKLEIKIKNGYVSSNVTEPFFINIKQETFNNLFSLTPENQKSSSTMRLLTINTSATIENFESYQSLALLTKTDLIYYQNGEVYTRSLAGIKDLTVNRQYIQSQIDRFVKNQTVNTLLNLGPYIATLLIFIGIFLVQLISVLILSLVILLITKIKQLPFGFKVIFGLTAAITFLVSLIGTIFDFLPQPISGYFSTLGLATPIVLAIAYQMLLLANQSKPPTTPMVDLSPTTPPLAVSPNITAPHQNIIQPNISK